MAQASTQAARDIGIDVPAPKGSCADRNCPFHGSLKVRGAQIVGKVVTLKMQGTAVVQRERLHFVTKYERYERRSGRYPAHVPPCLGVEDGNEVRIMECRPISKTVSYVIVERRTGA